MAKTTITCTCATCGATYQITVTGYNRKDVDGKAQWLAEQSSECPTCKERRIVAEREAVNKVSATAAENAGLPGLIGSPKQIAWATTIRQTLLDGIQAGRQCADWPEVRNDMADKVMGWLVGHIEAAWWIDNRYEMELPEVSGLGASYRIRRLNKMAKAESAAK